MPIVDQATFDRLVKHQAIAETGDVLYTIKHDGGTYSFGGEKFTTTQPSEPKLTPKAVTTPAPAVSRSARATKATEKEDKVDDAS